MHSKINVFENENYKYISEFVEAKIPILRTNSNFEKQYIQVSKLMEEIEEELSDIQKKKFDEMIKLIYKTEEYYFALAYSLGVKYGEDLTKI